MTDTQSVTLTIPGTGDQPMVVNGKPTEAFAGAWIDVLSPRDLTVVARVPRGGAEDIDRAVTVAAAAWPAWRDLKARERGELFRRIADRVEAEAERIARLNSLENGNAIRTQTRGEVAFLVDCFRYFAGVAAETKGETLPLGAGTLDYSRREPWGVVGAVVPWNAPLMMAALKIAPALVSGNTMVLKPAEDAPLAVLEVVRICQELLPPGVLNAVTGLGAEAGEALINHPHVAKLSFTGSTGVGKRILQAAADRVLPVSLELGGKSPQIVFPDADEDWVVDGAIAGMRIFRQGQSCTAGSRVFVHEEILDSFVVKLTERLERLTVGDPLEEATDIGAIVNQRQYDRVCSFIAEGIEQPGATLATGGLPDVDGPGLYVRPTVFTGVRNAWRIASEEIFGPVMCVLPWRDEDEVIRMANDTHYGLAGFVWSKDIGTAIRTAHALDAGWIQVNQGGGQALGQSFGGYKQSGLGREFSLEGMLESYTTRKHVSVSLAR